MTSKARGFYTADKGEASNEKRANVFALNNHTFKFPPCTVSQGLLNYKHIIEKLLKGYQLSNKNE